MKKHEDLSKIRTNAESKAETVTEVKEGCLAAEL